ncbi:hypothetical protein H6P81_002925 [Aristolochia fimbriata]|uniref:Uncharacterized protein n=1 Tax=Aristolochia fimbriata TaxID=158543 RepID=A0AAV7FF95_ARIFI|nr:hypothetical protein H6P81_002925 [Aristolochia fimbriata]
MALTVWFYEHTHGNVPAFVYDPSFKLVDKEAFPRVLKWGTRNYKHERTYKSLLNVNGLFQSLSCLEPISNEEALLISPLEEGSTPEVRASTPVREASTPVTEGSAPVTEASNPRFGETHTLGEETSPFGDFMELTGGCTSPLTRVNYNSSSNELVALKEMCKDLQEQLAVKDREIQQLREQVSHLKELLSLREGCGVGEDTIVQFEDPISEMGPEPRVEVPFTYIMPIRSVLDAIACDVLNPDHIDVEFDSIGGLEDVKQALIELVILPLKRPELFAGQLLSPQKGLSGVILLLFGISFIQFTNQKSMQNLYVLGISLFLGIFIPQYFNEFRANAGHGPVKTRPGWFDDILNAIFSSPPTVALMARTLLDNTLDATDTAIDRGLPW